MDEQKEFNAFDGHVHSYYSFDVKERPEFSPVSLFFTGLKRGMSFVAITDHDDYRQNEMVFHALKNDPILLSKYVPGTEFTIKDKKNVGHIIHVNVYMHTRKDFDMLMTLRGNLISFVNYCHEKKLPFQYNHPVWFDQGEDGRIGEKNLLAILRCGRLFPVIETCNSNRPIEENRAAELVARILGKGFTSNSDSHFGNIGARGYTRAKGRNFLEFWENVKKGEAELVKDHMTGDILKGKILQTIDHLSFPTGIKSVKRKYGCDTGNKTVNQFLHVGNRLPLLVRALRPYLRRKVRRTKLIDGYIEKQNLVGRKALEFFGGLPQTHTLAVEEGIKSYL